MKGLKIVLWIVAVACLLGFLGAVLPWSMISPLFSIYNWDISGFQGVEKYAVRLAFTGFGMIGIFFLILARDPLKYGVMLSLAGYGLLVYGLICTFWGIYYSFTWWHWLSDVLFCLITGGLILLFKPKTEQPA